MTATQQSLIQLQKAREGKEGNQHICHFPAKMAPSRSDEVSQCADLPIWPSEAIVAHRDLEGQPTPLLSQGIPKCSGSHVAQAHYIAKRDLELLIFLRAVIPGLCHQTHPIQSWVLNPEPPAC